MKKLIALTLAIMLVPPVGMYSHYVSLNPDSSNSGADTSKPTSKTSPSSTPSSDSRVLGATNEDGNDSNQIYFTVNIPSTFKEDISAPNIVYSVNGENGDIEIETRLVAGDGILVQGRTINNTGILTLVAGTGITVSDNIITNDGIVSLTAGTGIEIDGSEITNTYTFTPDYTQSGWTDNGSSVVLTTTSDSVTVGTLTTGAITASSITVDGLSVLSGNATIGNGVAVLPSVDLGSDLGSTSLRFNNLWVANINSNSSQSFSGQTTFSYPPTDTTLDEASVLINPTTSAASGQLLGLAIAGYQKAMIDEDGDITLGYQDQTSAPASDDPLNIYGHSGTRVSFIDTTGNAYFEGNVGIGISSPSYPLHITTGTGGGQASAYFAGDVKIGFSKCLVDSSSSYHKICLNQTSTGSDVVFQHHDATGRDFIFQNQNSEQLRILNNGNVGIGTTSPGAKLEVSGAIKLSGSTVPIITTQYGLDIDPGWASRIQMGNGIELTTDANGVWSTTERPLGRSDKKWGELWINGLTVTSGNVGIGATSPGAKLHIVGTEDDQQFIIQANGTQTANIFEWQNSSGTVLGGVDERGILFSDGGIDASSVYIGSNAGNISASGAVQNIGIGLNTLSAITSGDSNTSLGSQTLLGTTTTSNNVGIGSEALKLGNYEGRVGVGFQAAYNTGGNYTVGIGYGAARSAGAETVGIGVFSAYAGGSRSINIGAYAGYRSTSNDLLIIDNRVRADAATELSNSIIYGVMDATATNQSLRVNGEFQVMSGNVGIGTTSPNTILDIEIPSSGGTTSPMSTNAISLYNPYSADNAMIGIRFKHITSAEAPYTPTGIFSYRDNGSTTRTARLGFFVSDADNIVSADERMTINNLGNIGIGTTSPTSKLEIDGSALTDTNSAFRIAGGFGDGEYIDIGGLRKIGVLDGGNLFMGYNFGYDATNNSYEYDGSDEASGMEFTTAGEIKFLTATVGTAGDDFTPTARMTIDNNGNVGIGTTGPGYKLDITGNLRATSAIYGGNIQTDTILDPIVNYSRISLAYASGLRFYTGTSNAVQQMVINPSGLVGIGTTDPGEKLEVTGNIKTSSLTTGTVYSNSGVLTNTDPSDRNLKHNILTLEDGTLDKVLGLRPVSFNWNSTGDGGLSFIAQEVNEIFPELVGSNSDGTLGLYTTQFIPVLAKAIQEQQLEIDEIALSTASADLSDYATLADTNSLQDIIDDFKTQLANSVTSITGYFDEIFANKSHQKELCIGEFDDETCLSKNQVDQLMQLLPQATPEPEATTPEATPDPSGTPSPEPSASPTPSPETEASDVPEATESATP